MLLPSPESARAALQSAAEDATPDELLGDKPPWILGTSLAALGALFGVALAAVLILTPAAETVSFRVDSLPQAWATVRAPAGAQLDSMFVAEGGQVRVGDLLLRLRFPGHAGAEVRYEDISSPSEGVVKFVAAAVSGNSISYGDILVAIELPATALHASGEVPEAVARKLRGEQRVLLHPLGEMAQPPIEAMLLGVMPGANAGKAIVSVSLPHEETGSYPRVAEEGFTATAVLRRRSFVERGLELIGRLRQSVR